MFTSFYFKFIVLLHIQLELDKSSITAENQCVDFWRKSNSRKST